MIISCISVLNLQGQHKLLYFGIRD